MEDDLVERVGLVLSGSWFPVSPKQQAHCFTDPARLRPLVSSAAE